MKVTQILKFKTEFRRVIAEIQLRLFQNVIENFGKGFNVFIKRLGGHLSNICVSHIIIFTIQMKYAFY